MKVVVYETVPTEITDSINYTRIKHELHQHINNFCREKTNIKQKLHILRLAVGREYDPEDVKKTIDEFKSEFNDKDTNVGLDYSLVYTRFDFVVTVNVVIKRQNIEMKKFIFRYRKKSVTNNNDLDIKPVKKDLFASPVAIKERNTTRENIIESGQFETTPKKYKKTLAELKSRYKSVGYSIARKTSKKGGDN